MNKRTTTLEQQAAHLARRMAMLGRRLPVIMANAGEARSPSKRALLTAIEDQAQADGRTAPFAARFRRT
jgi:type II secretory pathway component PulJ